MCLQSLQSIKCMSKPPFYASLAPLQNKHSKGLWWHERSNENEEGEIEGDENEWKLEDMCNVKELLRI